MFRIRFKNNAGQSETVILDQGFHTLYGLFHRYGIPKSPYNYEIKDTRGEDAAVRLFSDSDVGNSALRLLHDNDCVYDAYLLDYGLTNVREELKENIEQNLLHEQYGNTEELFSDIRRMTISLAPEQVTFYCPIVGSIRYDEDGYYDDTDNATLLEHSDQIEELLKREQSPEINMAEYLGDQAELSDRLLFAEWSVEDIGGTLYGRIDCYLTDAMTAEETEKLRSAVIGQNSDGFGEGIEQREIPTEDGGLCVSFWNSGDDYFLRTQDEMDEYLSQQNTLRFGGIQ